MTDHRLSRSTVGGLLAAGLGAALLAASPGAAWADGSSNSSLNDLRADCGTILATPGFANGATSAACQGGSPYLAPRLGGIMYPGYGYSAYGYTGRGPAPEDESGGMYGPYHG